MNSKKLFSRRLKQEPSEPYYRTGGLLPIDMGPSNFSNGLEEKTTSSAGRRRLPNLKIIPPDPKQFNLSALSSQHNAALASSASNLKAVFSDMIRSPISVAIVSPDPSLTHKPLPPRPRSVSLPPTPDLPAELPGSILLDNQGFPPCAAPEASIPTRPVWQNIRRETDPTDRYTEDLGDVSTLLCLFPKPLSHAGSSPDLNSPHSTLKSVRSNNTLNASFSAKPSPLKGKAMQHLNETCSRKRSRQSLLELSLFTDSKYSSLANEDANINLKDQLDASKLLQPSPIAVESVTWGSEAGSLEFHRRDFGAPTLTPPMVPSKQIEELVATVTTRDQTILTLQSHLGSLRASHEAHIASFAETYAAEVASLKNHARVLEEQLFQHASVHHAPSNDLLFLFDTTAPPTPSCESSRHTSSIESAGSISPVQSDLEGQQRSLQRSQPSPEMESLKRRLSTSRRPDTANRNLLPELNQFKQNNAALQKQIESLMAKLNESKKSERTLKDSLQDSEDRCTQWQDQAVRADKIAKSAKALQNTIDNLENRLEIANIDKLDAEEQLFNLRVQQCPFDIGTSKPRCPAVAEDDHMKDAHTSMSTAYSTGSPRNSQEPITLSAFAAHMERLQDVIGQKDAQISELEGENEELRQRHSQLEQENNETNLRLDIQSELIEKTRQTDTHIEQLRTAIIDREAIIGEKEKSIRLVERQLEHHKLLLEAEIRKHAKMTLHAAVKDDPLPELNMLAAKEEVDKWINKLNQRLKKEKPMTEGPVPGNALEAQVEDMRQEIEFYVREIIYYKLDVKGYKSDIKKLKRGTTQLNCYGGKTSDLESDTSSLRPAPTSSRLRFPAATSDVGGVGATLSARPIPPFARGSTNRPVTPPLSGSTSKPGRLPADSKKPTGKYNPQPFDVKTPRTPHRKVDSKTVNDVENVDPSISPRPVVRLSPPCGNPTPASPAREKSGDVLMDCALSTLASNMKVDGVDGSCMRHGTAVEMMSRPQVLTTGVSSGIERQQPAPAVSPKKVKTIPARPPRPQHGLFDTPTANPQNTNSRPSNPPNETARLALDHSLPTTSIPHTPQPAPAAAEPSPPQQPDRKPSAPSTSNTPFVIAMGSPHNPTLNLLAPVASSIPAACSITRNCALLKSAPLQMNTVCPGELGEGGGVDEDGVRGREGFRTPSRRRSGSVGSVVTAIRVSRREKDGEKGV
ncbi:hypothetical protein P153DRAFT_396295 [Dothidotthia symphoricarpi CBS 119687]|uniref:Uncharacterized protein n=1 Tax=Dothidotthia symphoricarpi CBS 119687 TaxID=1392245 RepID=A0A6A6AGB5_9PLEO|nr:uncharacterized protein P153DRAFT_396295 [Dothidotthia symphoricarpi CBS 119687]KAF2129957.1 hypothetical protein P153DRAFT_396295 [Dothidotthia symphoricarpi CBS 119687]